MGNTPRLHHVLRRFRVSFLTYFTACTEQDYATLLEGQSETLLDLLQQRYGYTRGEAKATWNEFVLRHVDGHSPKPDPVPCRVGETAGMFCQGRMEERKGWWLRYQDDGAASRACRQPLRIYH